MIKTTRLPNVPASRKNDSNSEVAGFGVGSSDGVNKKP